MNAEDADPEGASQDEPSTGVAVDTPTSAENIDGAQVRFVLSSIGDEFDDSVDDNIIWESCAIVV